jgi:hypothetical protein
VGAAPLCQISRNCAFTAEELFETGPEGPKLDGYQVEIKSKAAQTKTKKLIRRTFDPFASTSRISMGWQMLWSGTCSVRIV